MPPTVARSTTCACLSKKSVEPVEITPTITLEVAQVLCVSNVCVTYVQCISGHISLNAAKNDKQTRKLAKQTNGKEGLVLSYVSCF